MEMSEICDATGVDEVKYVFPVTPCPAPRMTRSDKWKLDPNHYNPKKRQRPCVTRYFGFRDQLRQICRKQGYELTSVLDIAFLIEMPKSWSNKKKIRTNLTPHQSRPDRDNYLKAFQDSFDGDDGFVYDGRTVKLWSFEPMIIIF